MNAQDFVARLERSGPSVAALEGKGLSRAEAEEFVRSFRAPKRAWPALVDADLGTVGQLLGQYDCSKVEVGMVRLRSLPVRDGKSWVIGQVEADPIILDVESGGVRVEEFGTKHHVLWRCAKDGDSFLAALATAVEVLGRMTVDESLHGDDMLRTRTLSNCTRDAGGSEYEPFYRMLLGV